MFKKLPIEQMKKERGEAEYMLTLLVNECVYGYMQAFNGQEEYYWEPDSGNDCSKWVTPDKTPAWDKDVDWLLNSLKEFFDETKENEDGEKENPS